MKNNNELDENILYKGNVRCNKYKGKLQMILSSNELLFNKRKGIFKREYVLVDRILLKDIKRSNGKILIRQKDKMVEIITMNKSLLISFNRIDDASDFTNKIIEVKKNDTFFKRSTDIVKNIKREDVENALSLLAGVISIVGIFKNRKGEKHSKVISSSVNEIVKFFKNKK